MAYNSAYTGPQVDSAVGQVVGENIPAGSVKFTDGQTFQQKYDAGQLTGPQGPAGADGATGPQGEPGQNATINGVNALTISVTGGGITGTQSGDTFTLDSSELFTSVSEGKSLLAGAITDKGVSTSANDTFQQMANNVAAIETGGGSTWYADFVKFLKEQGDMHVLNQEYPSITVMGDAASFEGFYGVLFEEIANPENTILIPWPAIDLIGSQNNSFYGDFFFDGNGAEIVVSNMGANYGFQIYNFSNTLPCNMYVFKGSSVTF